MSLKNRFFVLCVINVLLCVLLSGLIYAYGHAVHKVDASNTVRLQSIMLANEIRQSSDDLTRLGRTYVVTGDPKFKQQYSDILDIRAGKKPRPRDYYRVYWDFISAGLDKPRPDGEAVSVQELMRRLGFTRQETDKLAEAVRNSDGLVRLEVEAMNLVEGKDAEGRPLPAPQPGPDRERAIGLVHSAAYHGFKAQIMKPLDDFYGLIEHRTDAALQALQDEAQDWFLGVIAALVAAVAAFLALAGFAYTALLRGYAAIGAAMERIAAGEYATAVPGVARPDEVGTMARCLEAFKTGLAADIEARHEAEQAERQRQRRAQNHDLATAFEAAVGAVVRTVTGSVLELRETAQSMAQMAGTTAERSEDAARSAADASDNAATVAAAAEELGASITEIGRRVADAAALTRASSAEAGRTAALVQELNAAATRVGDVVAMISGVASQTNLLALNATIEAARAGEAGRGFAVVASEVKELANQTARATDEISAQIGGIQGATREAVSAIAAIVTRIDELDGVSAAIAAAVEQQGATTQEIVRNVGRAANGAGTMRTSIGGVASLAGDTGAAAAHVLDIAAGVSRQADQLDAELARLLAQLRAA